MIWFANVLLLISMYLLGRSVPRLAWTINLIGNFIWVLVTSSKHQWDYASLSVAFVLIGAYNLWKAVGHARQSGTQASRNCCANRV